MELKTKLHSNEMIEMPEVQLPNIPDRTFIVTDFGAVGNGIHMNTEAIRKTIEACSEAGGGKVVIPAGVWLTGPIAMKSRINLHVEKGALVLYSKNFDDYPLILSSFEGNVTYRCQSPLDGDGLEDIAVTGEGIIDGSGEAWRQVKRVKLTEGQWTKLVNSGGYIQEDRIWWPTETAYRGGAIVARLLKEGSTNIKEYEAIKEHLRPNLLSFRYCKRVLLDGPTFQNSPGWNVHPFASEHITIRNVQIKNNWFAQNGDGLDLECCSHALIENSMFDVGDDAICMKSGKDAAGRRFGKPTEYVTIRNCVVYHGHGGFVVGSEMSGGVRNVVVTDCTFLGTDVGLRFKSTRGRGGVVENIWIDGIRMKDIPGEAILFHLYYGLSREEILADAVPVTEETPVFRNIHIKNTVCAGAKSGIRLFGLPEAPVEGVTFENVTLEADRGIECTYGKDLSFDGVTLKIKEGPLTSFTDCENVNLGVVNV